MQTEIGFSSDSSSDDYFTPSQSRAFGGSWSATPVTTYPNLLVNAQDLIKENKKQIEKANLVIKALKSGFRQEILQLIMEEGSMTVKDLYTTLKIEQSIVSQHLAILKSASLVESTRDGKVTRYAVNFAQLQKVIGYTRQLAA
jgi:DNA-binding transcriptional ArsR family regulator